MRKITLIIAPAVLLILAAASAVSATLGVEVQVSPQTLLLDADQGGEITVHAAIDYSLVDTDSVTLDGIPASYTKQDNRGELVAKFPEWAVKDIVAPPSATLVLSGQTVDGESFSGSDVVRVIAWPCLP